jgi:hypothetical protein
VEYKQFPLCARLLSYSQKRLTTPFSWNIPGREQAIAYFNTSENLHVIKTNFKPLTNRKKNLIHDITHYTFLIPQMWRDRVDNLVRQILCPAKTLYQSQIINPLYPHSCANCLKFTTDGRERRWQLLPPLAAYAPTRAKFYVTSRWRPAVAGICECVNEPSGSIKCGEFLD